MTGPGRGRPRRLSTVLVVAVVSLGAGGLAVALGLPWWILAVCLVLVLLSAIGFG